MVWTPVDPNNPSHQHFNKWADAYPSLSA
jgi:hypothetical protein